MAKDQKILGDDHDFSIFVFRYALFILLFTFIVTLILAAVTGRTLGLFIGPMMLATILVPPLVLIPNSRGNAMLIGVAIVDGIAGAWLAAVLRGPINFTQWLECYLVLTAYAAALLGVGKLLRKISGSRALASALTTILALAWITWPIWWPAPDETAVSKLVRFHPMFAINGVVQHLGYWVEQRHMYHVTTLGQDVSFSLPPFWPAAVAHAVVGLMLIPIVNWRIPKQSAPLSS